MTFIRLNHLLDRARRNPWLALLVVILLLCMAAAAAFHGVHDVSSPAPGAVAVCVMAAFAVVVRMLAPRLRAVVLVRSQGGRSPPAPAAADASAASLVPRLSAPLRL